ncbi:hypothetical protein [Streptomyces tsukubensis]|uniref:Uncharacterized protein n=1 Tax=Streptomyces tsukubensis TaxID=83656 RepID=A0A1V4A0Q4_9ACTN|nr:hypothetical protein [Streptomyces tsukubensis]OON72537.1 hypothetical protein B1H18_29575 [Streptomyces tsukubensis]QFR93661.1 hypothetical protein GBW32_11910 [Streptomyces tsukubensis]
MHADPGGNRHELWAWLHTEDAAASVLAALTADLTGAHVVNVAAPDSMAFEPTRELLAAHHPAAGITGPVDGADGHGTLFDTTRSRELLHFTAGHTWRDTPFR